MMGVIKSRSKVDPARDMKISPSNFTNWRKRGISLKVVVSFALEHSVSIDWLLYGVGEPKIQEVQKAREPDKTKSRSPEQEALVNYIVDNEEGAIALHRELIGRALGLDLSHDD